MTLKNQINIIFISLIVFSLILPDVISEDWNPSRKILVYESSIPLDWSKIKIYPGNWLPWSPDGKFLAISPEGENRLIVIDTATGNVVFSRNYSKEAGEHIMNIGYSPDGKYLYTYLVSRMEVLDTETWESVFSDDKAVGMCSWSPDGRYLAYSTGDFENGSYGLAIVSIDGWEVFKIYSDYSIPAALSWSPDGKYIAYFDMGPAPHCYIRVIDTETWKKIENPEIDVGFIQIYGMEWSPDSRYLVSADFDWINKSGSISVWDTTSWNMKRKINLGYKVPYSISWNPYKPILAVGLEAHNGDKRIPEVRLMNTDNWTFYMGLRPLNQTELSSIMNVYTHLYYYSVAWSPNGNSLLVAYKDAWVYTTEEGLFETGIENNGASLPLLPIGAGAFLIIIGVSSIWYWKKRR